MTTDDLSLLTPEERAAWLWADGSAATLGHRGAEGLIKALLASRRRVRELERATLLAQPEQDKEWRYVPECTDEFTTVAYASELPVDYFLRTAGSGHKQWRYKATPASEWRAVEEEIGCQRNE